MSSINIKIGIKTSLCFLLIFCYTISCSGCNRVENDTLQKPNKALTIISYCAKETTEKNQIYFHYPYMPGIPFRKVRSLRTYPHLFPDIKIRLFELSSLLRI